MERFFHNTMYAARWILAPVYFGLSFALLLLAIKFFQEVWHVLPHILQYSEADLILGDFIFGRYDHGRWPDCDGDVFRL